MPLLQGAKSRKRFRWGNPSSISVMRAGDFLGVVLLVPRKSKGGSAVGEGTPGRPVLHYALRQRKRHLDVYSNYTSGANNRLFLEEE